MLAVGRGKKKALDRKTFQELTNYRAPGIKKKPRRVKRRGPKGLRECRRGRRGAHDRAGRRKSNPARDTKSPLIRGLAAQNKSPAAWANEAGL